MHLLAFLSVLVACVAGVPTESTKPGIGARFVGGSLADITNFPYQLSLHYNEYHYCGAAIISKNWAVTAAQCVHWHTDVSYFTVRAGSTYPNSGGTVHSVTRIIQHEKFNKETNDYDIALLKVSPAFTYSSTVRNITLQETTVSAATKAIVTGWELSPEAEEEEVQENEEDEAAACPIPILEQVALQIQSDTSCQLVYWQDLKKDVTPRMICAGTTSGGKAACEEDYGSPLVAKEKLVGIMSWSNGCGEARYPGVYTKISALRAWIKTNAGV